MDAKHTPLPWKTHLTDDTLITGPFGREVAEMCGDYAEAADWPVMEANAALICEAVNNYHTLTTQRDMLVKALEMAVSWIEDLPRKNASHQMLDHCLEEIRKPLSALSQTKEGV